MGQITVGIGDAQLSKDPGDVLVTHALGSCIAVAIHDPIATVAGLLHILLPNSKSMPEKAAAQPYLFADTGIPEMFHAAYKLGAQKSRLTVRVVGGAQVMDPQGVFNIGKQNYLACRRILWAAGILISAEEVGGTISRTVRLTVACGRLEWNTGGGLAHELAVPSRRGPVGAQLSQSTPQAVSAQLSALANFINGTAPAPDVPTGVRAQVPWSTDCVSNKGGR